MDKSEKQSDRQEPQKRKARSNAPLTDLEMGFYNHYKATGFNKKMKIASLRKAGSVAVYPNQRANQIISSLRKKLGEAMVEFDLTPFPLAKEHARIAYKAMDPRNPGMPNDTIRLRAIDMAYNLQDVYPPKKIDIDEKSEQKITVSMETIDRARRNSTIIEAEVIEESDADKPDIHRPL